MSIYLQNRRRYSRKRASKRVEYRLFFSRAEYRLFSLESRLVPSPAPDIDNDLGGWFGGWVGGRMYVSGAWYVWLQVNTHVSCLISFPSLKATRDMFLLVIPLAKFCVSS